MFLALPAHVKNFLIFISLIDLVKIFAVIFDLAGAGYCRLFLLSPPVPSLLLSHNTILLWKEFWPVVIAECLYNVIVQPRSNTQWKFVVLEADRIIRANILLKRCHLRFDVSFVTVLLNGTNKVYEPIKSANLCHDVAHVRRIHSDLVTMAHIIHKYDFEQIDKFLNCTDVSTLLT